MKVNKERISKHDYCNKIIVCGLKNYLNKYSYCHMTDELISDIAKDVDNYLGLMKYQRSIYEYEITSIGYRRYSVKILLTPRTEMLVVTLEF